MAKSYTIYNSAMATTAAPVKQPTGTAIRTMMQLKVATGVQAIVTGFGYSFDGSAAATPGIIEIIETGAILATMSSAYAAADIQPYNDYNATANTAGTSGVPFNLGTSASGFATAAVTEGSTVASRMCYVGQTAPTNQLDYQFPLGREFAITPQNALRFRVTFGTTVNMICYLVIEI